MVEFTYENQGTETLLVYHLDKDEHLDSFAKGMLQSNEMAGILRPSFIQADLDQYLKFQVTSKIPLKDYLKGEMEKNTVLALCFSVAEAIREVEEYMLSKEKLIMDTEYIFVDVGKKEVSLLYLPVDEYIQEYQEKEFLLYLLSHMRYQLTGDISYVAKIIHFLNEPKRWEFKELQRYIKSLVEKNPSAPLSPPPAPRSLPPVPLAPPLPTGEEAISVCQTQEAGTGLEVLEKEEKKKTLFGKKEMRGKKTARQMGMPAGMKVPGYPEEVSDVNEDGKSLLKQKPEKEKKRSWLLSLIKKERVQPSALQSQESGTVRQELPPIAPDPGAAAYIGAGSSDDNKTVILGGGMDYGSTVILGDGGPKEQPRQVVRLTRRRNGQSMTISEEVFHIGREGSFVHFYIGDNPAIGAVHADIFADEGQYYISDRNSLNHTYVNGSIVAAGQPQKLRSSDVITLANEDFDFIIS